MHKLLANCWQTFALAFVFIFHGHECAQVQELKVVLHVQSWSLKFQRVSKSPTSTKQHDVKCEENADKYAVKTTPFTVAVGPLVESLLAKLPEL